MRTTGYRRDGRDGLGDNGFLSIQVLLDRLPINHLLQLQQREAVDMLGNYGLCGLPEEDAHRKFPKYLGGNLGDLENFAKVSGCFVFSYFRFSIAIRDIFKTVLRGRSGITQSEANFNLASLNATNSPRCIA